MWKAEFDEEYFRIFDSKKNIAGYIDPDYGIAYEEEGAQEKIEAMIDQARPVRGAFLTVPMVKFSIFDTDYSADVATLESQLKGVIERTGLWRRFAESWPGCAEHYVRISHTDHDMLSITFPVSFGRDVPLRAGALLEAVRPMLDRMHEMGLL